MGLTLRKRILLGYAIIAAVLVIAVGWSVASFWRLRTALRDVLVENYRSVVAAESMVAALERQDSGVLMYVAGERELGESTFAQSQTDFHVWYARAIDNITVPGEREILIAIEQEYSRYSAGYLTLRESLLAHGPEVARRQYLDIEYPSFSKIRELCADLQRINSENMMRADKIAGQEARRATVSVGSVAILAIVSAVALATKTSSRILDPLARLKETVADMAHGHFGHEISTGRRDEVGELADEFSNLIRVLRKKEEETVGRFAKQQAKLESLVKSLSDGIVVLDADFRVEMLNPKAEAFLNVTDEDAYGLHFLEILDDQAVFGAIKKSLENKVVPKAIDAVNSTVIYESKVKARHREETRYHAVTALPIRTQAGSLTGVVVVFSDITKYKELDEVKSQFVSTAAHEFRTPLTSITMSVGLLLETEEIRDNKKVRPLIDMIRDDAGRLTRMVNELLDLSKIQAGKIEVRRVSVAASDLVDEALKPFRAEFSDRSIELAKDVPSEFKVRADPDKIVWVIYNLVGNALRYTPAGGRVTVGARSGDSQAVELYVSDTGQGIAREDQTRIFQRFFQVTGNGIHSLPGGAGLGLAISKEIVEAHGGRIWVESQPGKGSTFVFTLQSASKVTETGAKQTGLESDGGG